MFDLIENALVTRTTAQPSSPLVVSVPHAACARRDSNRR